MRIIEGKVLARQIFMLETIMGAKEIPVDLRETYKGKQDPLPDFLSTWRDFWIYLYAVAASDEYDQVPLVEAKRIDKRLLPLQAIHFQELLDEHEAMRKDVERREAELKERRMKEGKKGVRAKSGERKPLTSLTTNVTANFQSAGLPSLPELMPRRVVASKPQARYPLTPLVRNKPTIPSTTPNSTSFATRQTKSKLTPMFPSRKLPSTPADPRHTRASTIPPTTTQTPTILPNKLTSRQGMSPPLTPIPHSTTAVGRASYMSPTRSSTQRYAASSPQLFFSDGSSDECSSATPTKKYPKNGGRVLQRGRVGR
jgi:hypothetical protein